MDPVTNPYVPGAGSLPPELAGRENIRERVRIAVARLMIGNHARGMMLIGIRGVGKTALLTQMRMDAVRSGAFAIQLEANESRSFPAMLAQELHVVLLRMSTQERARNHAMRALRALASFARSLKVRYQDLELGIDFDPEPGLADTGDLEYDLRSLLEACGDAARDLDSTLVLFLDELQYLSEQELSAFAGVMHRISQSNTPVLAVGAGLPQLIGQFGRAKSYAERLFEYPEIGALNDDDARFALSRPAEEMGVLYEREALDLLLYETKGYPYFLQQWGKQTWDLAIESPITADDVHRASAVATAAMDAEFFRMRFERLSPTERKYLRAMAELGGGALHSRDIATILGRTQSTMATIRGRLIEKGMLYSPEHGVTAYTVPMFDTFMKRIMPGDEWRT